MGQIAKQSIQGTIATYIGVAIGFVTTFFVITRFLSPQEVGLQRVLVDAATLFIGLAQLGTNGSIVRFFPYFKDGQKNHGFFFWTLIVPLLGFLVFGTIYILCYQPLSAWFAEKSPLFVQYYYMVLPIAFFMLYQTVFETNASVLMKIVIPRTVREIGVRIGLLLIYLLFAFDAISLDGFVVGLVFVYAGAALINLVYLFSLGLISLKPDWAFLRANKPLVRSYGLFTAFCLISALTSVLGPSLSSFFVTAKMGLDYTGIFAIATYMAVMVSIPYRSVTAITQPELAQAIKEQDTFNASRLLRQSSTNLLLVGGFILLAIWLNIDLIYSILPNGETYAQAKMVVLILGVSQLLTAVFAIFLAALSFSRYYAFSLLLSLLLTVSSLVLNNYLIPLYGINGAAWATLIANCVYYVLATLVTCLGTKTNPFHIKQLYTLLLLLAVFGVNALWQTYLPIHNIWLSAFVRDFVLLGLAIVIAYYARLSDEINSLIRTHLRH